MESTSNALRIALDRVRKSAKEILELSEKEASSTNSSTSESLTALLREGSLSLADMKSFNRAAMFGVEQGRQKVHASLADSDIRHLELQNLLYERSHLLRQIQKCREFPTPEFDKLVLVPVEEMVMAAAAVIVDQQQQGSAKRRSSRTLKKRRRGKMMTRTNYNQQRSDEQEGEEGGGEGGGVEEVDEEEEEEEEEMDEEDKMNKIDIHAISDDIKSLFPSFVTILMDHYPRLLEVAIEAVTSLKERKHSSRRSQGSGDEESIAAVSKELITALGTQSVQELKEEKNYSSHQHKHRQLQHDLILAQLNHELEQRKSLEEDLEKSKARTSSIRAENKARATFIDELPKKLESLVKGAQSLQASLLEQRQRSVLNKEEENEQEEDSEQDSEQGGGAAQGREKRRRTN
jgi:hypothetical protein